MPINIWIKPPCVEKHLNMLLALTAKLFRYLLVKKSQCPLPHLLAKPKPPQLPNQLAELLVVFLGKVPPGADGAEIEVTAGANFV
jgi:hypothetical protein